MKLCQTVYKFIRLYSNSLSHVVRKYLPPGNIFYRGIKTWALDSMEWNGNKLDTSDWFSPSYRPPLNKDHLLIKTTQIK